MSGLITGLSQYNTDASPHRDWRDSLNDWDWLGTSTKSAVEGRELVDGKIKANILDRVFGNSDEELTNQYYKNRAKEIEAGVGGDLLAEGRSIKVTDSLKFVTPKGNIVYGGGGIIPDIFVPKDTSIEKETLEYISRSGFASYFVFEYLEKNRDDFTEIIPEDFITHYQVNDSLFNEFLSFSGIINEPVEFKQYQDHIKIILKASIAQQLYGTNTFELILNNDDQMIQKVLKLEAKN